MTPDEARAAYLRAKRRHENASRRVIATSAALASALGACQDACPHPADEVFQGECGRGEPPFRVCVACGYAEAGWGDGYTQLKICYDHNIVHRAAALQHVRGGIIPNAMHTKGRKP